MPDVRQRQASTDPFSTPPPSSGRRSSLIDNVRRIEEVQTLLQVGLYADIVATQISSISSSLLDELEDSVSSVLHVPERRPEPGTPTRGPPPPMQSGTDSRDTSSGLLFADHPARRRDAPSPLASATPSNSYATRGSGDERSQSRADLTDSLLENILRLEQMMTSLNIGPPGETAATRASSRSISSLLSIDPRESASAFTPVRRQWSNPDTPSPNPSRIVRSDSSIGRAYATPQGLGILSPLTPPASPPTPTVSSRRRTTPDMRVQCSGTTVKRKQCKRRIEMFSSKGIYDPLVPVYCRDHK